MPESYREYLEGAAADDRRMERFRQERDALRLQVIKLEIQRMKEQIAMLEEGQSPATASSPDESEASLLEYLRSQPEPVEEDKVHDAVEARRATIQKTLRSLVEDGKEGS